MENPAHTEGSSYLGALSSRSSFRDCVSRRTNGLFRTDGKLASSGVATARLLAILLAALAPAASKTARPESEVRFVDPSGESDVGFSMLASDSQRATLSSLFRDELSAFARVEGGESRTASGMTSAGG